MLASPDLNALLGAARAAAGVPESWWASDTTPDRVLAAADRHGLLPVLAHACAVQPSRAPAGLRSLVRTRTATAALHGLRLAGAVGEIDRVLRAAGVAGVFFKGPVLSLQLYGDPAVRRSLDIDVLVPPAAGEAALCALRDAGYRLNGELAPVHRHYFRHAGLVIPLRGPDGTRVELHPRLLPGYLGVSLDEGAMMARAVPVALGDRRVRGLGLEDLAVFLPVHAAKHEWERLAWVHDLAALARHAEDLDWDAVARRARNAGVWRMVTIGFGLAHRCFAAPLPPPVARTLAADTVVAALLDAAERTARDPAGRPSWRRRFSRRFATLQDRWRDRIRYRVRTAVMLSERDFGRAPAPWWRVYYLTRPFRLLRDLLRRRRS